LLEVEPLQSQADFIYPAAAALAEGYLLAGRAPESELHAQQALERARTIGTRGNEALALLRRSREVDRVGSGGVTQGRNGGERSDQEQDQEWSIVIRRCS
jgi:hypothetical protein